MDGWALNLSVANVELTNQQFSKKQGTVNWLLAELESIPQPRVINVLRSNAADNTLEAHSYVHVALMGCFRVKGVVSANEIDLQSQTLLTVAGCGRLQLGAAHWATSVVYI